MASFFRSGDILSRFSSVMKKPGAIAFTRTPRGAHSRARVSVKETTPNLLIP